MNGAESLVRTLVKYGYVQPDPASRRYMLGQRITSMSWQVLNRMPIRDRARSGKSSL